MKAALFESFGQAIEIVDVPEPVPPPAGVVIRVEATGICRSDWHGWMGHDSDVNPPHVPGHELAGVIEAVGRDVKNWQPGDRVTVPFVCGCGSCPQCQSGNQQVCDHQTQPGFTHWGSFAEFVAIEQADMNLVRLPQALDYISAASLGCRFVTSFRAVIDQGRVSAGDQVAVFGCGGVGLSAIMIAAAVGAKVMAVDIAEEKLKLAERMGATRTLNVKDVPKVVEAIKDHTGGGAHVSIDALGDPVTCHQSVSSLRKRGRHIQVGLLVGEHCDTRLPMNIVVANELEVYGSHGIQAHRYGAIFNLITQKKLDLAGLIGRTVSLGEGAKALMQMDQFAETGIAIIDTF